MRPEAELPQGHQSVFDHAAAVQWRRIGTVARWNSQSSVTVGSMNTPPHSAAGPNCLGDAAGYGIEHRLARVQPDGCVAGTGPQKGQTPLGRVGIAFQSRRKAIQRALASGSEVERTVAATRDHLEAE